MSTFLHSLIFFFLSILSQCCHLVSSSWFLSPDFPSEIQIHIDNLLLDIFIWMSIGHLKIIILKTKLLIPHPLPIPFPFRLMEILPSGFDTQTQILEIIFDFVLLWEFISSPLRYLSALLSNIPRTQSPYNSLQGPKHSGLCYHPDPPTLLLSHSTP